MAGGTRGGPWVYTRHIPDAKRNFRWKEDREVEMEILAIEGVNLCFEDPS
jgi:hypothetical protein